MAQKLILGATKSNTDPSEPRFMVTVLDKGHETGTIVKAEFVGIGGSSGGEVTPEILSSLVGAEIDLKQSIIYVPGGSQIRLRDVNAAKLSAQP